MSISFLVDLLFIAAAVKLVVDSKFGVIDFLTNVKRISNSGLPREKARRKINKECLRRLGRARKNLKKRYCTRTVKRTLEACGLRKPGCARFWMQRMRDKIRRKH